MSTVHIDDSLEGLIQGAGFAGNRRPVLASCERALVRIGNKLRAYCGKELFTSPGRVLSMPPSSAAETRSRWRGAAHLGPYARQVNVLLLAALQDDEYENPRAWCEIRLASTDAVIGTATLVLGSTPAGPDGPDGVVRGQFTIDTTDYVDSDVYFYFYDANGSRLIAATVWEQAGPLTTEAGFLAPGTAEGSAILDEQRLEKVRLNNAMVTSGCAHLFAWSSDLDASAPVFDSTSWANVLYPSQTSVDSSSVGPWFDLTYRNTESVTTVPVVFCVHAFGNDGSDSAAGEVGIYNSSGTQLAVLSNFDPEGEFQTITVNLPASVAKYDIRARGASSGHSVRVTSVSMWMQLDHVDGSFGTGELPLDEEETPPLSYSLSIAHDPSAADMTEDDDVLFNADFAITVGDNDQTSITVSIFILKTAIGGAGETFLPNPLDPVAELEAANTGWSANLTNNVTIGSDVYSIAELSISGLTVGTHYVTVAFDAAYNGVGKWPGTAGYYTLHATAVSAEYGVAYTSSTRKVYVST